MATIYVNPDLGSGGDGSFGNPYGSWSSVTFAAGNTYAQRCGSTKVGGLTVSVSGTSDSPITLTSYDDDGNIPGHGQKPLITTSSTTAAMALANRSYVNVTGYELRSALGSQGPGLSVSSANNVSVSDCTIIGDRCGIYGSSATATPISNIVIDGNDITIQDGTGDQGCIFLFGVSAGPGDLSNVTIRNNHIHDSAGQGINCSINQSAVSSHKFVNLVIENNVVHGNVKNGIRLASTRDAYSESGSVSQNVTVRDNEVYSCGLSGISLMTFNGGLVYNNEVYDCSLTGTTGGLQLAGIRNVVVANNRCYNNHTTANYDGCGLFLDVYTFGTDNTYETSGCLVVGNECWDNDDWAKDFATWIANSPKGFTPPSSGIRLYRATNNIVTGNYCHHNSSGIALEQGYNNYVYNNTLTVNTIGLQTTAMMPNAGNVIESNASVGNERAVYDSDDEGSSPSGTLTLSGTSGRITLTSSVSAFSNRDNYYVHETSGTGLAIIYEVGSSTTASARVIRTFSGTTFSSGQWSVTLHVDGMSQYDYNAVGSTVANYKDGDTVPTHDLSVSATLDVSTAPSGESPLSAAAKWRANARGFDYAPVPLKPDYGCFQNRSLPGRKSVLGGRP